MTEKRQCVVCEKRNCPAMELLCDRCYSVSLVASFLNAVLVLGAFFLTYLYLPLPSYRMFVSVFSAFMAYHLSKDFFMLLGIPLFSNYMKEAVYIPELRARFVGFLSVRFVIVVIYCQIVSRSVRPRIDPQYILVIIALLATVSVVFLLLIMSGRFYRKLIFCAIWISGIALVFVIPYIAFVDINEFDVGARDYRVVKGSDPAGLIFLPMFILAIGGIIGGLWMTYQAIVYAGKHWIDVKGKQKRSWLDPKELESL